MNSSVSIHRIWVVDSHPIEGSFCSALAESYVAGSRHAGHDVRLTCVRDLRFDYHQGPGPLEPDLVLAQECLQWCDHMVVVYPNWWGTYPALFKAFQDRILLPGFAFEIRDQGWMGLLSGRTAQMITTMDTPLWVYRWILGAPGIRAMKRATFGFCGIRPVQVRLLGPIHSSTPEQRAHWLGEVFQLGRSVDKDLRTSPIVQFRSWLAVARLQFYPFPLLVLATGAWAAAAGHAQPVQFLPLAWAAGCGVLLEFSTVLTNELEDQETDRQNRHAGLFTGGSRVLVEGRLSSTQLLRMRAAATVLLAVCAGGLALSVPASPWLIVGMVMLGWLLGHQYSAKPLRLSYRGWGELDVAFTHSFLVAGLGYASQGGTLKADASWAWVLAIFASVLPSIILAGFPDREADLHSGKNTLMVQWGSRRATQAAITATALAMFLKVFTDSGGPYSLYLTSAAVVHGGGLLFALWRFRLRNRGGKIDRLLMLALTFMLWFGLEPFLTFYADSSR